MDFDAILDQILISDDAQLAKMNAAIKQRREILQARTMAEIKKEDIVIFNDKTRPKYLQGLRAKVKKINKTTVGVVVLDEDKADARKYGYGQFRCPIGLVNREKS